MSLFYFDLVEGDDVTSDEMGEAHADLNAARRQAIRAIRDILSADLRAGYFSLDGGIRIRNGAGQVAALVPFSEAVAFG